MLALNTWNPWNELADLHRDLDAVVGRMFRQVGGPFSMLNAYQPSIDIRRANDTWKAVLPVPGIDPSAIEIDLEGRELRIRAERREIANEPTDGAAFGRVEQRLTLPDDVDTERVAATYHLGVLELTLPVKESARPRRIEVHASPEAKQLKAA